MTNKEYDSLAKKLGYVKLKGPQRSHGQPVYRKGHYFISPDIGSRKDIGSHNGGVWKKAKSLEELLSKDSRLGTYDAALNRIKD